MSAATGQTIPVPLAEVEQASAEYAAAREALSALLLQLEADVAALKRGRLDAIKRAVVETAETRDRLHQEIDRRRDLFESPRTRVLHGIRVGLQQAKPKVEIDDEAAVIRRIREKLPADQAELLIRTTERVHKPAVYDLDAADLKRLGIGVSPAVDLVIIKAQDSAVAKLVDALLEQGQDIETI